MGLNFRNFFIGAAFIAASFIPGLNAHVVSALRLLGSGLASSAFTPGAATQKQKGVLAQGVDTDADIPIVYGVARVGPSIVFQDTRDTARGPNTRLDMVATFCLGNRIPQEITSGIGELDDIGNGRIGGFGTVFFDEHVAWHYTGEPGDLLTKTFLGGIVLPDFTAAEFHVHRGAHDQTVDSYMFNTALLTDENAWRSGSEWTSAYTLKGVAYIVFAFRFPAHGLGTSEDVHLQQVFPGGIPSITAMIQGRKVYDPRSEVWEWSDNLALCIRDYLLDERSGCALTLDQLDDESCKLMADASDQIITDPLSIAAGLQQFRCNGVVDTSRPVIQNLQELLATGGMILSYEQGVFRLKRMDDNAAVSDFVLDETNIIGDWSFSTGDPSERVNTMIVKYVDGSALDATEIKDQVAETHVPAIGASNPYKTADGEFEVPRTIELSFVNNESHAYIRGLEELTRSRNDLTVSLRAMESALALSIFDKVKLSHREFSMQEKEFWVVAIGINPDDTVQLGLREVDSEGIGLVGGGDAPTLAISSSCSVVHGAQQDPPSGLSSGGSKYTVTWGTAPAEDADHTDYRIQISRGPCANFDPVNSTGIGESFDCGMDAGNTLQADTTGWDNDGDGFIVGGQCASKRCSSTMMERWFKARWIWKNALGVDVYGDWSAASGPHEAALVETDPDWTADPNFCVLA